MIRQALKIYCKKPFLSFITAAVLVVASPLSWGHANCQSYEEQLVASGQTPFGGFNGGASVSFGGNLPEQALATSVILKADDFDPSNPGPILLKRAGSLLFAPGMDGSTNLLTVVIKATGVPTGPTTFAIDGKVRFTGGVGKFEHARGRASFNGDATVDPNTGFTEITASISGKICRANGDD